MRKKRVSKLVESILIINSEYIRVNNKASEANLSVSAVCFIL
jgi:hypothetical protein